MLVLNDYICANSTLAGVVALNRYLRAKYPWSATIEPSTFAVYTPGLYHLVAWDYDPTLPGTNRLVFITDTQINISNRVPKTTISGIEVERYTAQQ